MSTLANQFTTQDSKLLEKLGAPSKLIDYVNDKNDLADLEYQEIKNWYDASILSKFSENHQDRAFNIKSLSDVLDILNPSKNEELHEAMKKLAPDTMPDFHCVLSFSYAPHPKGVDFRTIDFVKNGERTHDKEINLSSKDPNDVLLAINTGYFFQQCYEAKKAVEELMTKLRSAPRLSS